MVPRMVMHTSEGPRVSTATPTPAESAEPQSIERQTSKEKTPALHPSGDCFHDVVAALAQMASVHGEHSKVVTHGFLLPLVNILTAGASEPVMLMVLRTLAHLAGHKAHHSTIRTTGVMPALLNLLQGSNGTIALGVLEVLRPLARDHEMKGMLREAGAFKPLVKLIQTASRPETTPPEAAAAEAALAVVKNLAASSTHQDALRAAGAIRALVASLDAVPATSGAAVRAAAALSNLAVANATNKDAIREAGALPRLMPLLGAGGEAAAAATEAIGNLAAKNAANKDAIREVGGVAALASQFVVLSRQSGGMDGKQARLPRRPGTHQTGCGSDSHSTSRASSPPRSSSPTPSNGAASSHGGSQGGGGSRGGGTTSTPPLSPSSSRHTSLAGSPACSRPPSRAVSPRTISSQSHGRPVSPPPLLPMADRSEAAATTAAAEERMWKQQEGFGAMTGLEGGTPIVPSPPGTARTHPGPAGGQPHHHGDLTIERTAWALRNLTAASGLNTAVMAASGITLKALEAANGKNGQTLLRAHGDKQSAPPLLAPQPKVPPPRPPQPPTVGLSSADGDDDEESHGPMRGGACAGVALTQWSKTGRAW